jgi:L-aspartate oxidase
MASAGGEWPADQTEGRDAPRPDGPGADAVVGEAELRDLMWQYAGVFRDREGLAAAETRLELAWRGVEQAAAVGARFTAETWRAASLATVSRLIVRAAIRREESRGAHSRTDFPGPDDARWRRRVFEDRSSR